MTLNELAQKLEELGNVKNKLNQAEEKLYNLTHKFGDIKDDLEVALQEERVESLRKRLASLQNININSYSLDEIPF
jgi:uncharacterized coiled-coil protein SlyX